jgi:anion-transporting  ArsA/GET3 family ATPase
MTRLSVVVGTGGVGKTTAAIVLALRAAAAGDSVLLLTVDPARRLADALGLPLNVRPTRLPGPHPIDAAMLDREAAWDHYVRAVLPTADAEALAAHPWFHPLVRTLNGGHEWIAVATLARLAIDGAYDHVVLDTPPSGHVLDLLEAPKRLQRSLDPKRLSALLGGGGWAERAVGAVVRRLAGPALVDDLANLLQRLRTLLDALREDATYVEAWLKREETTAHLVIDARRSVDAASIAGWQRDLSGAGLRLGATILQRYPPDTPPLEARPPTLRDHDALATWMETDDAARQAARSQAEAAAASLGADVLRIVDRPGGFAGLDDARRA